MSPTLRNESAFSAHRRSFFAGELDNGSQHSIQKRYIDGFLEDAARTFSSSQASTVIASRSASRDKECSAHGLSPASSSAPHTPSDASAKAIKRTVSFADFEHIWDDYSPHDAHGASAAPNPTTSRPVADARSAA
eukprot:CAMPEP_0113704334 /NCGR_PEP_ID=MMETSP0038_2-20120614/26451_1 /TAXON_ID=2898 /ORGANISM="Cryptomonas paramecium" /LENGTH=134 /DNA_ID=CAMNT_0000629083 /DNA_START=498 /DNA_END=899 /DNA_ORIENTATION=+ /assembly_acc=CAM_ASM_000170